MDCTDDCMGSAAEAGHTRPLVAGSEADATVLLRYPPKKWEGWGCSLAWLGKALGSSSEAEAWADLLFTHGDVGVNRLWPDWAGPYMPQSVPGLGLNIARYNVGGTGRPEDQAGENRSTRSRGWHAEMEGFQPTPGGEFDWSRDEGQRRFLDLAVERGVNEVEFFSNAPMWWMSRTRSSFGGGLVLPDDFAIYLAEVVSTAKSKWNVPVRSVAPFNEPSADWWKFPHTQEGCRLTIQQQVKVISRLRDELDKRGMHDVIISASDENSPEVAARTWKEMQHARALQNVGCLNVHSYDGLEPWREHAHPGCRTALRLLADGNHTPLRVSEHGDFDPTGAALAQAIFEDLHYLRPTAWCYWQPVEHNSSWGFVEAEFSQDGSRALALPQAKYFVFAHFSRFLRAGICMLHCTQPWVAAGYSPDDCVVACVFANPSDKPRKFRLHYPAFSSKAGADAIVSEPKRSRYMVKHRVEVVPATSGGMELHTELPANSMCSLLVNDVQFVGRTVAVRGLTCARVLELARAAALGAADERCFGIADARTMASWARWEHLCCAGAAMLGDPQQPSSHFRELIEMVCSAAWGTANERSFGAEHSDVQQCWARFHAHATALSTAEGFEQAAAGDLTWMIFNQCWAVANERWFGPSSADCVEARGRAAQHFGNIGADTIVLRALTPPLMVDV